MNADCSACSRVNVSLETNTSSTPTLGQEQSFAIAAKVNNDPTHDLLAIEDSMRSQHEGFIHFGRASFIGCFLWSVWTGWDKDLKIFVWPSLHNQLTHLHVFNIPFPIPANDLIRFVADDLPIHDATNEK